MKHTKINLSRPPFYSVRVLSRGLCSNRLRSRLLIANQISRTMEFIEFSKVGRGKEVKIRVQS
jgi:hypothetical protein